MKALFSAGLVAALVISSISDAEARSLRERARRAIGGGVVGGALGGAIGGALGAGTIFPPIVKETLPPPLKEKVEKLEEEKKTLDDDIKKNAAKAVKDLEREASQATQDLIDTAKKADEDSRRAYAKGWKDTADAVKAVGRFAERQAAGTGNVFDAAERRIREGKFVDAFWHTTTDPLKQTSKNAGEAVQESAVLNTAAAAAATAYGGPAGASAYAAWFTYNQTKDLGLALKAGIVSGALSVGLPPGTGVGGQIVAGAAKGATVAIVEGGDVESMKKAMISGAIAGGVQGIGQLPQGTTAEAAKKAIVAGAIGGIAVAAAGGDDKAVREAFIREGGRVIVQYAQQQAQTAAAAVVKEADTICISATHTTCETVVSTVNDAAATYQEAATKYKETVRNPAQSAKQGVAVVDGPWAITWDENVKNSTNDILPSIVVTIDVPR